MSKSTVTFALLFILVSIYSTGYAQMLPIDFENDITSSDFINFDGGTATVIDNPQSNGINTSMKVAQIVRDGGQPWAGSKIDLAANLDFTTLNSISMKFFTTAPIGTIVKIKLEGAGTTERDLITTVSNEWAEGIWDFTGEPANFKSLVFMFDFNKIGDGSATSTFLFDDIEQRFGGSHLDLPVDFEGAEVNYTMSDFGGNESLLVSDPMNPNNTVMQVIKTNTAATWAGTTIGTPAGFANDIPLTLSDSKMTVSIWSPEAGTPIRLKVEDSSDPTHTCETETKTTVSGEWEDLEFNFSNQAPGTELLSVGLSMGWTYNMASIFFNFGTDGATAGAQTYYFDNVAFGALASGTTLTEIEGLKVFPNPSYNYWSISSEFENLELIQVYDLKGNLLTSLKPTAHSQRINNANYANGIYVCKVATSKGTSVLRLIKI